MSELLDNRNTTCHWCACTVREGLTGRLSAAGPPSADLVGSPARQVLGGTGVTRRLGGAAVKAAPVGARRNGDLTMPSQATALPTAKALPLAELLGLAGVPVAIREQRGDRAPQQTAADWDRRVGVLVHAVVAVLVPVLRAEPTANAGDVATEIASRMVTDRRLGNLARARGRVAGMASLYAQRLMPPPSVLFLGAEVRVASGARVDLAWDCPRTGVFYDEIKSWRQVLAVMDEDTNDQVHRYLDAGLAAHGSRFAGVRLLTLSALPRALFVDRLGAVHPLAGSVVDPAGLAVGRAA